MRARSTDEKCRDNSFCELSIDIGSRPLLLNTINNHRLFKKSFELCASPVKPGF